MAVSYTHLVKDGTAKLLITFPDAEEYLRFAAEYPDEESGIQVESLDVVSVQDGVEKGYIVGSNFYKAGDEKTEVSAVDITKQKKFYVCLLYTSQRDRPPRRSPQRQRHLRKVGSRAVCTFLRERVFCDIKRQICGEYVTKGIKLRSPTQACLQAGL